MQRREVPRGRGGRGDPEDKWPVGSIQWRFRRLPDRSPRPQFRTRAELQPPPPGQHHAGTGSANGGNVLQLPEQEPMAQNPQGPRNPVMSLFRKGKAIVQARRVCLSLPPTSRPRVTPSRAQRGRGVSMHRGLTQSITSLADLWARRFLGRTHCGGAGRDVVFLATCSLGMTWPTRRQERIEFQRTSMPSLDIGT